MKLSLIVPVYNVKPFLNKCIDSLIGQTVTDYEIILIDDGSTDGSESIIRAYADRFPELVRFLRIDNGGQGRARNFGIEMAQGKYLGFVDSDDWVDTDMYRKLCDRAEETDADIVVCDFTEKFDDGRENYLKAALQDNKLSAAGSACNKIFRRALIGDIRFPQGLWYEDFYFSAMMLIKSNRIEFVHEPLYFYRRGQVSTMHNNNARKNLDILSIMDMLSEYMIPEGLREDFEFMLINHVGIDSISRLAEQEKPDRAVIKVLQQYMKEKIPELSKCESFKREALKRRIICFLNCTGRERTAQLLLKLNRML